MNEPLNTLSQPVVSAVPETDESRIRKKRLVEYATDEPFFVLQEVFIIEDLEQLKQECLDWFHVALVAESVYCEEERHRQGLFALYQALLPLMEALFIIHKRQQDNTHNRTVSKLAEAEALRKTDENRIKLLRRDEISNPMLVVSDFCRQFTPEIVREELWDWLNAGICYSGEYPDDINEVALLHVYDHILCFTEVAYELSKRETLKPSPVAWESEGKTGVLEKITGIITETCQPEKIFLLHIAPSGQVSDGDAGKTECNLLVLMPDSPAARPYKEYQSLVDAKCNGWASVLLTFTTIREAYEYLQAGHLYYSVVCKPAKLVYDAGKEPLPEPSSFDTRDITQKARSLFATENKIANDFLEGARYYQATRKLNCAAFLLHQAAERILTGFLFSLTGHNYFTRNLFTLLQKTKSFTTGLTAVLTQHPEKEKGLLILLNKAYTHTRYRNDYTINSEQVALLLKKVEALKKAAARAVEEQLIAFEKLFKP